MQHKISKNFLALAYFTVIFIISSLLLLLWFCKRKELCPSPQKPLLAVRWGLGSPQAPSCTHQPCRTELKHCIYGVTLPGACAQVQDKNGATGTDTPPHWKEQAAGHVSHTTVVWKEHEVGPVERKGTQLDTASRWCCSTPAREPGRTGRAARRLRRGRLRRGECRADGAAQRLETLCWREAGDGYLRAGRRGRTSHALSYRLPIWAPPSWGGGERKGGSAPAPSPTHAQWGCNGVWGGVGPRLSRAAGCGGPAAVGCCCVGRDLLALWVGCSCVFLFFFLSNEKKIKTI